MIIVPETPSVVIPPTSSEDYSLKGLKAMLAETAPEPAKAVTPPVVKAPEAKTEATDPAEEKPPVEGKPDAASETVKAAPPEDEEDTEDDDEGELDPGVQKKIAKEVRRLGRADRAIAEAVSARKAKEAELAKLTADKPGSEPDPKTASAKEGKPVKPKADEARFNVQGEDGWAKYQAALDEYETAKDTWLIAETERTTEAKLAEQQRMSDLKKDWDAALKTHGEEFRDFAQKVMEGSPEGLQFAISGLENWPAVTVYLAKHPKELQAIVSKFEATPYRAIADLGKLEDRLTQVAKPPEPESKAPAKPTAKQLPPPPAKVGGAATPLAAVDLEKTDMRSFKREIAHMLER